MIDPYIQEMVDQLTGQTHCLSDHIADLCTKAVAWNEWYNEGGMVELAKASDDVPDEDGEIGDFMDYELILAATLAAAWALKSEPAHTQLLDALDGTVDRTKFAAAIEAVTVEMSDLYTEADTVAIRGTLLQAAKRGQSLTRVKDALENFPRFADILEGMVKAGKYYGNAYFEGQVVPRLYDIVENAIQTGTAPTAEGYRAVREALDARLLKKVPYWQTHASAAASRAYHYGLVRAGTAGGYRGYRLVAVRDARTSDICIELDGREFWLADAMDLMERVAAAGPEELKDVHPWITGEEKRGLTEDQVYDRAVYVPPFHGRCRTTMQLLSL